jgi:hypothetical protein
VNLVFRSRHDDMILRKTEKEPVLNRDHTWKPDYDQRLCPRAGANMAAYDILIWQR